MAKTTTPSAAAVSRRVDGFAEGRGTAGGLGIRLAPDPVLDRCRFLALKLSFRDYSDDRVR